VIAGQAAGLVSEEERRGVGAAGTHDLSALVRGDQGMIVPPPPGRGGDHRAHADEPFGEGVVAVDGEVILRTAGPAGDLVMGRFNPWAHKVDSGYAEVRGNAHGGSEVSGRGGLHENDASQRHGAEYTTW
jgi:hypothetical protein